MIGGGTNLLSLVAALVGLTLLLAGSLVVVEGIFTGAEHDAGERATALTVSEGLVDGEHAKRSNVLSPASVDEINTETLRELGADERHAIGVRIDGESVAAVGDPTDGTTVRRIVMLERTERVEEHPGSDDVTLPSGVDSATVRVDSGSRATIETVRVDGRVVLHDPGGLDGRFTVDVPRQENATMSVEADDRLTEDEIVVTYEHPTREPAVLAVTAADRSGDP